MKDLNGRIGVLADEDENHEVTEELAQKKDGLACSLFWTIQQEEVMPEVNTMKEPTFVSAQEWLQSFLSTRWLVLTLYQVMKEGMRHQLA